LFHCPPIPYKPASYERYHLPSTARNIKTQSLNCHDADYTIKYVLKAWLGPDTTPPFARHLRIDPRTSFTAMPIGERYKKPHATPYRAWNFRVKFNLQDYPGPNPPGARAPGPITFRWVPTE